MYIPSLLSLPPFPPSHPPRSSQSTWLDSLCYTTTSHQQLSIYWTLKKLPGLFPFSSFHYRWVVVLSEWAPILPTHQQEIGAQVWLSFPLGLKVYPLRVSYPDRDTAIVGLTLIFIYIVVKEKLLLCVLLRAQWELSYIPAVYGKLSA